MYFMGIPVHDLIVLYWFFSSGACCSYVCFQTVECPICQKSFPQSKIEEHADGCANGAALMEEDNDDFERYLLVIF